MAIHILESSSLNSNAYNRNEYLISSSLSDNEKFAYNFNILYDSVTVTSFTPKQYNGRIFTEFVISDNNFVKGDKVLIVDNQYGNVVDVNLTTNSIIVDVDFDNINFSPLLKKIGKPITYKIEKEPTTSFGWINVENTLRSFVSTTFIDTNDLHWTDDVLFKYELILGEEYKYEFNFDDNTFVSGNAAFHDNSLTAVSDTPFQVGDKILIEQDLYEWSYSDNYFSSSLVGYTGSEDVPFATGSQVYISGQDTFKNYNGYNTVNELTSGSILVTDTPWLGNTPVESGVIYGTPKPSYNDVATIKNIYYTASLGVVIQTDLAWGGDSPVIPGKISFADGRLTQEWEDPTDEKLISVGYFDKLQESQLDSETFHIDDILAVTQSVSSIISFQDDYTHRVEKSSKGNLLLKPALHSDSTENGTSLEIKYNFYDDSNALLGTGSFIDSTSVKFTRDLNNSETGYYGIYVPIGLNQLNASTHFSSSLSTFINAVDTYTLEVTNGSTVTKPLTFEVNDDCAGYETYHLIFKDSMGSYVPVPFVYKSFESTETNTKTYYQKEGSINTNTNTINHNTYDRGKTNLYKRYTDKIRITSGWLNESENLIIKDLLTSPEVLIQDPSNNVRAVQLLNTELDLNKKDNVQIFNYTFDVAMSIDSIKY